MIGKWYRLAERYVSAMESLVRVHQDSLDISREMSATCARQATAAERRADLDLSLPPVDLSIVSEAIKELRGALDGLRARLSDTSGGAGEEKGPGR